MIEDSLDLSLLNPGIRRTVALLRANDFETVNSGDGVTHECVCDSPFPYVTITVEPLALIDEADRLYDLMTDLGIEVGYMAEDGSGIAIEAAYWPTSGDAYIILNGVDDDMLFGAEDEI